MLSMTQLTFNFKISNTTEKKISFFANFEKKLQYVLAQSAMKRVKTLKEIHNNIVQMQQKFTIYQNKKRKTMFKLKKKNKIYLLTKNLKTKKISKKLDHVKIDSFFINKQTKSINYKLNLFSNIRIHLVFHVSLLKSTNSKTSIQNTFYFQYEKKNKNEIETILTQNGQKYFIKRKEYFISKNI